MTSLVPYGSNPPSLAKDRQSNLQIAFNMRIKFDCDKCKEAFKDCLCFCSECRKCLHPVCAGVKIGTAHSARDRSKQIVLPAPEELPESCRDCLRRKPKQSALNSLLLYDHQGNSEKALVTTSSSITRFLESSNEPAHELMKCMHDDFLIHKSTPGHELEQRDSGTLYSCSGCKEKGFGPHHACQSVHCSFCLHEECKSPRATMMHPFFPGSSFAFHYLPAFKYCNSCKKNHSNISCNACGIDVNGYYYGSQDNSKHLHPCCANLPRQIMCGDTGATMVLRNKSTLNCWYCGEKNVKVEKERTDKIWSYVSRNGNFQLHVPCIIKMLSDLGDGSRGRQLRLSLYKKIGENGVTDMKLEIAAGDDTKKKWEKKFRTCMKYAKIALGAIISAFLGDPTTFIINLMVALISPD